MKKTFALLLFGLAVLTSHAEVIVYKVVQTNSWVGGGTKFKQVISGRLIVDVDTAEVGTLIWLPNLRFQIDCPKPSFRYLRGPKNSDEAAWFLNGEGFDLEGNQIAVMQTYLRGTNALIVDLIEPLRAPKRLRGTYRASYDSAVGLVYVGEGNLSLTYTAADTRAANENGFGVMDVLESMRQTWEGRGWVEVSGDAPCF